MVTGFPSWAAMHRGDNRHFGSEIKREDTFLLWLGTVRLSLTFQAVRLHVVTP